jgi:hypothetical protein
MNVRVKLHGGVRSCETNPTRGSFGLALRAEANAGDLLRALAERCGEPFRRALDSDDSRLPRHLRLFVNGEMLVTREQPVVPADGSNTGVTVVVLTPMMGG